MAKSKSIRFRAVLENIAKGMEYYAVMVPAKVTEQLGVKTAVPVRVQVNDSESFVASFHPMGSGRHRLRIRNQYIKAVGAKVGDRVIIRATVRDRNAEVTVPRDLQLVLQAERMTKEFQAIPLGERSFLLRKIDEAVKPETRAKRVREAVQAAHRRREK